MNMIEKVARAIVREKYANTPDLVDSIVENLWKQHIWAAKAAIEAMKEPIEEIIQAGCDPFEHIEDSFKLMIEAALKE